MAQVLLNEPTPNGGDLDANFTELYSKTAWSTAGIGYATGAGGAITQATSKSTTVTINKVCGQITMNAASLAAGARVGFDVINATVAQTDAVVINRGNNTGTFSSYRVFIDRVFTGGFTVIVENASAGALAEALVLNFAVIKAVNS